MASRIFFFVVSLTLFSSAVLAAPNRLSIAGDRIFYAEPDVGFVPSFSTDFSSTAGSGDSDDGLGVMGGFNLGWRVEYVHFILGYRGSLLKSADNSSLGYIYQDYGFGLGWEWNIPLMTTIMAVGGRLKAQLDGDEVEQLTASGGFGIRFAISYFMSENFKLNFQYSTVGYDYTVSSVDVSNRVNVFHVSLSFPFNIPYPEDWWRLRVRAE